MKTAAVTDLKNRLSHFLRLVARGETITILDRGTPVAQITPPGEASAELTRLAKAGLARLPIGTASKTLWTRPLPIATASVAAALQSDRDERLS